MSTVVATSSIPLYHGTSSYFKDAIMRHGLRPRSATGKSVYTDKEQFGKNLESDPSLIYLTDTYPFQFASWAVKEYKGHALICSLRMDPTILLPDTDFKHRKDGVACLSYSGTCAVKAESLMPQVLWVVEKRYIKDHFGTDIQLFTGIRHKAFESQYKEAMGYTLMSFHKEKWVLRNRVWEQT